MKTRPLVYAAARALPVYPRIPLCAETILVLVIGVTTAAGVPWVPGHAVLLLAALGVPVTGWWVIRQVFPAQTTDATMKRRGDREQRAGGVASVWDVMENGSAATVRRQATILRPSLATRPRRERRAAAVGYLLATNGIGTRWGQQLWSSSRDHTLRVGAPGTRKTLSLSCHGLDAPGALITTSTRLDLAQNVHIARRIKADGSERAVHVFNPTGSENTPGTVRWSILTGCEVFATAARRATDLIPKSASIDQEVWLKMARTFFPILLHAAAVSGRDVGHVLRWVTWMSSDGGRDRARRDLVDILIPLPNGPAMADHLDAFMAAPDRGRGSALLMMTTALGWINDDDARQVGDAPRHTVTLDLRRLILETETLHIIGQSQAGNIMAPLTSALAAEFAYQVRMLAAASPGGRLDPPATALLDEAAVATRLPLDEWSADMGGAGMTLHMSVQSLSQLSLCWGHAGAQTLKGNAGSLILFGGGMDTDELEDVSVLCGHRQRRVVTEDTKILARIAGVQRGEWEKVRVLTPAQLSQMPPGQAAVLKRNLGGVFVGRPPTVLDRKGWQRLPLDAPPLSRKFPWRENQPQPEPEQELA